MEEEQKKECSGCSMAQSCSSQEKEECNTSKEKIIDESNKKEIVKDNHKTILVMSGKGGVGKTTVSVNLAYSLFKLGHSIGILDADIHGPNVPKMMGLDKYKVYTEGDMLLPVELNDRFKMISVGSMVDEKGSVIWRGPMKHNVIKQFTEKVKWGKLDYLIVDFPPGTGDECISAAQVMKDNIMGAIIVSTPQQVSIMDSIRSIDFCKQMEVPVIGLIENMSGGMFGEGTIEKVAKDNDVPFLGKIRMDAKIVKSGEVGRPFVNTEHELAESFEKIVEKID